MSDWLNKFRTELKDEDFEVAIDGFQKFLKNAMRRRKAVLGGDEPKCEIDIRKIEDEFVKNVGTSNPVEYWPEREEREVLEGIEESQAITVEDVKQGMKGIKMDTAPVILMSLNEDEQTH